MGRTRVLVVDGSAPLRDVVMEALIRGGYYPCPAEGKRAALLQLVACDPHVVIVSSVLPDGTAAELAQEMHTRGVYLPIVAVTRRAEERALLELAGVTRFLAKPYSCAELVDVVRSALEVGPRPRP